ncbi:MAG: hypothetical protein RLY86_2 [Pseudomonadota bacterium]
MKTKIVSAALATASVLALTSAARAQTLDYSQYEAMFGEPVTTSALGIPQRASNAPSTMTIITQDEIRRSGVKDIPELLARVAGVDMQRAAIQDFDIGIRGYNQPGSSRLLVMINGRQIYVDHLAYTVWEALPVNMADIRQIEIVKGPNTALFGFNAVSGVINIITFNPLTDDVNQASVSYGTGHRRDINATATLKLSDWGGVRFSVGSMDADGFTEEERFIEASPIFNNPERRFATIDSLFQVVPSLQVGLEGSYADANTLRRTTGGGNGTPYWKIRSVKGSFAWENGWGTTKGQAYANLNDSFNSSRVLAQANRNMVGQVEHVFRLGSDHALRAAVEARRTDLGVARTDGITALEYDYAYNLGALSGSWNWQVTDTIAWSAGARIDTIRSERWGYLRPAPRPFEDDDFNRKETVYSYNATLSWQPDDLSTLRLTHARGIQFPNLVALSFVQTGTTGHGNPDMEPSVVNNFEVSYDRRIEAIATTLRTSLFHTITEDMFGPAGIGGTRVVTVGTTSTTFRVSDNFGDSAVTGLEVSLKGDLPYSLTWGANYTWLDVNDDFTINRAVTGQTGYETGVSYQETTPRHAANVTLGWTGGPWAADLFLSYVGQSEQFTSATTLRDVPERFGLGGRVGYTITENIGVEVSGINLNQKRMLIAPNRQVDRQVFGTLTIRW